MSDALHTGCGVIEGLHEIVWVRGPDTVRFLDGLISQDVANMQEGTVAHSLLLAPNGKLRAPHVLWRGREAVALVTAAGGGEIVAGDLNRFRIRVDVQIEVESRPLLTLIGPQSGHVLTTAGLAVPGDGEWLGGDAVVGSVPFVHGGPPRFVLAGVDVATLEAASAARVDRDAFEALRIERGEPVVGRDVGDSTIPQEMGSVDQSVSFTKGCYLGQELVARIDSRGHVNRHLRGIVFGEGDVPASGATLVAGDSVVGEVTSVAQSDEVGAVIALAMVRREVAPDDRLSARWGDREAIGVVRELPLV